LIHKNNCTKRNPEPPCNEGSSIKQTKKGFDCCYKNTQEQIKKKIPLQLKLSYAPSINRNISKSRSVSIHKNMLNFKKCGEYAISIPNENGQERCYNWDSEEAKQYLLDNLLSKTKIKGEDIIGPKQTDNNCWFNSFFTMFFISDKARKFMRSFRIGMIKGEIISKIDNKVIRAKLPGNFRKIFWLLNSYITACLIGNKDPHTYAKLIDTNNIIGDLYKELPKKNKSYNVGEGGDFMNFYVNIIDFLNDMLKQKAYDLYIDFLNDMLKQKAYDLYAKKKIDMDQYLNVKFPISYYILDEYKGKKKFKTDFNSLNNPSSKLYKKINKLLPHMLIIELKPDLKKKNGLGEKQLSYNFKEHEYKLDSIGILDTQEYHICSLITINNEDYMFDGENESPLIKQKWRDKLNQDQNFKITNDKGGYEKLMYNLRTSSQKLLYYRVS
jgi:hypothetical protein